MRRVLAAWVLLVLLLPACGKFGPPERTRVYREPVARAPSADPNAPKLEQEPLEEPNAP